MRVVLGIQPVREAIRARSGAIERIFVEDRGGPKLEALARFARDQSVLVERVGRGELDRRAAGGRHQGVLAVLPELPLVDVDDLDVGPAALHVALDGVIDPQNFGAVVRSAVALGANGILWPEHASAPLTAATFRASAGAVEHATLCRVASLPAAMARLAERGVRAVVLDANGSVELADVDLTGPTLLVVGAEDRGARPAVRKAAAALARLPMRGPIASLNASVAAALGLYEVVRQRRGKP